MRLCQSCFYKKIIIIEPYFGNILERLIRKKNPNKEIYTIGYDETIIYKYGTKEEQDNHLSFDDKSILKKIKKYENKM